MASSSNRLMLLVVVALVVLVGVVGAKLQASKTQLEKLTVRLEQLQGGGSNASENREEANRVIQKVKRLMVLDESVTPTVATIVDVESLRERNEFYEKAENGDFLLVTPDRAVLYNEKRNVIVDVVPVQLSPQAGAGEPAPAEPTPAQ